jgi:hypothetical protein
MVEIRGHCRNQNVKQIQQNQQLINILAAKFAIAPMMDWTDCPEKLKKYQHLSGVAIAMLYQMLYRHSLIVLTSEQSRASKFVRRMQRKVAYYASLTASKPPPEEDP